MNRCTVIVIGHDTILVFHYQENNGCAKKNKGSTNMEFTRTINIPIEWKWANKRSVKEVRKELK